MLEMVAAGAGRGPEQAVTDQIGGEVNDIRLHVPQYQLCELGVLLRERDYSISQEQRRYRNVELALSYIDQ